MSQVKKLAQYELEDGNRVQKALSIIVRDQSTGNRNNNLAIIENSGIFLETLKNYSIKYDLARSCFLLNMPYPDNPRRVYIIVVK